MKDYELMIIFEASIDEDAIGKELQKITAIIEKQKGQVTDSVKWGFKKLAYPIKHQDNGYYHILYFTAADEAIKEIDRVNKINDRILRHLIVKPEKSTNKE